MSNEAQSRPPGTEYEGKAFTFHQIHESVYIAIGTGNLVVASNGAIVINDDDVLLVDTHISPASAWALREEMKEVTDKPVRYVVNTHFHFDHAHGNQIYGPEVEIIGHEFTRDMIVAGESKGGKTYNTMMAGLPQAISGLKAQVADTSDQTARAELERQLHIQENYAVASDSVDATPPTITLTDQLSLFRGGREIRMIFLGRAHTGGDVVVHLPEERILITGDLIVDGAPYMGDGYLMDWAATLDNLKSLDFDVILPGHGQPLRGKSHVDDLQEFVVDLLSKITESHKAGVPADQAAQSIDMLAHSKNFPSIVEVGVDLSAVERAYELFDQEG
ncbi:MAG: MBL fold metallo-hydrolase [SAR202 cluster bacterium]|nr:MBL fold metallo-hydrolase [SAR202 cluster bacterium]